MNPVFVKAIAHIESEKKTLENQLEGAKIEKAETVNRLSFLNKKIQELTQEIRHYSKAVAKLGDGDTEYERTETGR